MRDNAGYTRIVWVDDNHLADEMSYLDFGRKVEEIRRTRDSKYGRDGLVEVWRRTFRFKGVAYDVAVCRYFTFNSEPPEYRSPGDWNLIGKHAVLEHPPETGKLVRSLPNHDEFLYADTLHSHQRGWTLRQQVEEMIRQGRRDISSAPRLIKEYEKDTKRQLRAARRAWNIS